MPSTPEAIDFYFKNDMGYGPAKAANAAGVACSGLEMSQNSTRLAWDREKVEHELHEIMKKVFKQCKDACESLGKKYNYQLGANVAGFKKVADAMISLGCV